MSIYNVVIEVRITDEGLLFDRATASFLAEDPNHTEDEARAMFEDDLGACLIQLIDPGNLPGASIVETYAESF
ncbi:hypothetical protein KNJ79_05090 [Sphingopyxis indica]|uniref:hypothetical protein n=1 Tax=Sphingopyxis indica TaxID=436663 RepID=UPI0029393FCC|nr:hypothetical protein [Sphingopyxis indica]WOF44307.1 hypothetical protein KNJ79_05090 [Sphingopyxis indica]